MHYNLGSGTFILSNMNQSFLDFMDNNTPIREMFYIDDQDLDYKINYFLENEVERENIAKKAREYLFNNHSYEKRMEYLISNL